MGLVSRRSWRNHCWSGVSFRVNQVTKERTRGRSTTVLKLSNDYKMLFQKNVRV